MEKDAFILENVQNMLELSHLLISGTLLFTFTYYYLLKTCLVEWACRRFLKDRIKIVQHRDHTDETSSARASDGGKLDKDESKLKSVTKGDLAEISQL